MRYPIAIILTVSMIFMNLGCGWSKAQKGAAIGAGTGAAAGAAVGKATGHTAAGAIAGAAVGGVAGGYIGNYMDKQAADMKQGVKDAKIERVGEGIQITFDSAILFDVDKAILRTETRVNLTKFSEVLKKYPDTNLLIEGHTDSTGTEEYNLKLSEQRAQAVADFLAGLGVDSGRFTIIGRGESSPVATNDTPEGRQLNRRVEIAITANEKLKETAKANAGQ